MFRLLCCLTLLLLGCKEEPRVDTEEAAPRERKSKPKAKGTASPPASGKASGKPTATLPTARPIPWDRRIGKACETQDEADCLGKHHILTCDNEKQTVYPCEGPKGCKKEGVLVKCDESIGIALDACSQNNNYACSSDKASQLKCVGNRWHYVSQCRGPNKCKAEGLFVKCDTTIAKLGDPCDSDGDAACSVDGKQILECKSGTMATKETCPKRCNVTGRFVQCQE